MGRRATRELMLGLFAACVVLGVWLRPAAADSVRMDVSYRGVCRAQCCDASNNCSVFSAPWTGNVNNRQTGDQECVFDVQCQGKGANLVKASSRFFFETGCWEDWSRYDAHDQKIRNSEFTLGCAANQVANASPAGAPALAAFNGQLYDFFESNESLSFVTSNDGANWTGPSALKWPGPLNVPIKASGQVAPLSNASDLTVYRLLGELAPPPGTPANCLPYPACTDSWNTVYTLVDFNLGPDNVVSRDYDNYPIFVSLFKNPAQDRQLDGVSVVSFHGSLLAAAAAGQGPALGRLSIIPVARSPYPDPLASYPTDSIRSDGRPSMAVFNGQLWLAFRMGGKLQIMTSGDGRTFAGPKVAWDENNAEITVAGDPSLVVFNGHLYAAFASANGAHPLIFRTFMNWTRGQPIFPRYSQNYPEVTFNGESPAGPISLSPFGSGLQASFRGADGSLYVTVP